MTNNSSMISEDKISLNYLNWIKRLERYGCYSEYLIKDMGERLKVCSYALKEDTGGAYSGSMIDIVLNTLCRIALDINDGGFGKNADGRYKHPQLVTNTNMLIRVLLLQHISKAEMFVPQSNDWKLKNGIPYGFNTELATSLKLGERSIMLCMKYGIQLTEEEFEAMRYIDKTDDDINGNTNPLAAIVRIANQMTNIEIRRRYISQNK